MGSLGDHKAREGGTRDSARFRLEKSSCEFVRF